MLSAAARLTPPAPSRAGDTDHPGLRELVSFLPPGAARSHIPELWQEHEDARRLVVAGSVPQGYPAGLSPAELLDKIDARFEHQVFGVVDEGTLARLIARSRRPP